MKCSAVCGCAFGFVCLCQQVYTYIILCGVCMWVLCFINTCGSECSSAWFVSENVLGFVYMREFVSEWLLEVALAAAFRRMSQGLSELIIIVKCETDSVPVSSSVHIVFELVDVMTVDNVCVCHV